MVKKDYIQNIIGKYNLEGLVDVVKWVINDKVITIQFISNNKDLVGCIKGSDFDVKKSEIALFDTGKLSKLLSILDDELHLEPIKEGSTFSKLLITDKKFDMSYSLASMILVPKIPKIDEPKYNFKAPLTNIHAQAITKGIAALQDSEDIFISSEEEISGEMYVSFKMGTNSQHSNKIKYLIKEDTESDGKVFQNNYKPEVLRSILNSNKGFDEGKIFMSEEGLLKLEFKEKDIESVYFLIPKEK